MEDDDMEVGGYARLVFKVCGEFVDYESPYEADTVVHEFTSVIPHNDYGMEHTPGRVFSAGETFGMDLARLAKKLREHIADWQDVTKGFEREMREPY